MSRLKEVLNERFKGFGRGGTIEKYGKTIVVSQGGKSIELTVEDAKSLMDKLQSEVDWICK